MVRVIDSALELERQVLEDGFLPFFRCGISGFSIEERTAPEYWFSDEEGPWEWKGPVIREGHCAYGKFFNRKAGYVSLEWLPHLANYRRSRRYAKDEDTAALDDVVLQTIDAEGGVTVKELRRLLGFASPILTRLMMGLHVVIADFEYNVDRHGRPYGWGVARYTVPERLYGRLDAGCTPEESHGKLLARFRQLLPYAPERKIALLMG